MDVLKRTGVEPTIRMFNSILKCFIDLNKLEDANKLWIRMHWEECSLDKEAFTVMMKTCTKTGQFVEIEIVYRADNVILRILKSLQ